MKKVVEGVVLWHVDGEGTYKAFDVFVRKGLVRKYKKEFNWLYRVDCIFAKAFQELFKNYTYVGSEDDLHLYPLNPEFPKSFKVFLFNFRPSRFSNEEGEKKAKEEIKKRMKEVIEL
jgi:hypothetical protein